MKIFLLFYMCDFAVGLTHCYKTTVFFYIYTLYTLHLISSPRQARIKIGLSLTCRPLLHNAKLFVSLLTYTVNVLFLFFVMKH